MQFISFYTPGLGMNIRYLRQFTSLSYQAHSSFGDEGKEDERKDEYRICKLLLKTTISIKRL